MNRKRFSEHRHFAADSKQVILKRRVARPGKLQYVGDLINLLFGFLAV